MSIFSSCNRDSNHSGINVDTTYIQKDSMIDTTGYRSYETFDEWSMCGVNANPKTSHVLIKKNEKNIFLKMTNNLDSTIIYYKTGNEWINQLWLDWDKRGEMISRSGLEKPARMYYRILKNDSIIEFEYSEIMHTPCQELFIKTSHKYVWIHLFKNDIKNVSNPYDEIKGIVSKYNDRIRSGFLKERDSHYLSREVLAFEKQRYKNVIILKGINCKKTYTSSLYYLDEFGSRLGMDSFINENDLSKEID